MARTKSERKRIYRETVSKVLADKGMKKSDFCDAMGHTDGWYGATFSKGYYDITKANLRLWSIIIGCTEEELTAIPMFKEEPKAEPLNTPNTADMDALMALVANHTQTMVEGIRMLHTDIRNLIETMDKYWKPTEPKYEVKEREQP